MISKNGRKILRDLAKKVADIADLPIQSERRDLWKQHNSLRSARPMILVFPEGAWGELMDEAGLFCKGEDARQIERELRRRIYYHEHLRDDSVIEKEWIVHKAIRHSGWGLEAKQIQSPEARGAWKFDPVIYGPQDLKKLRYPEISLDDRATEKNLKEAQDLFGDILDVKLKGVARISFHLMQQYTYWRGLEETMLDMYEQPAMLHDTMAFLEQGHQRVLRQYVEQNLLSENNDGTYQNSGGNGYTDELPKKDFDPAKIRLCDLWASAESQEMAQVGPAQHEEFALAYEKRLLAHFGLNGYGCCEDLSRKLDRVFTIPNIRRISISPFADVDVCAEKLKGGFIFSWKPHPAHLVGDFNKNMIRNYIRHTLQAAKQNGCILEMILKDTHTCERHPERFERWVQMAREEVDQQ